MVKAPTLYAVPTLWPGSTVVCIATGPSLTQADVDYCRGKAPVIVVNDAHRLAQWADVLYACDAKWWRHYEGVKSFTGLRFSIDPRAKPWGVQVLQNTGREGLELQPTGLKTGKNSGAQALNLAVHFGAKRVVLLGYDMSQPPKGPSHCFGEHPKQVDSRRPYGDFIAGFQSMAPALRAVGVEVVNCSRVTALTCFPRQDLTQALPERLEAAS